MNTITKNELIEGARLAQIYSAEIAGQGYTPSRSQAVGPEKLLRAEFQNGALYQRNLPFGRLLKWVGTFPENETFCITFTADQTTLRTVRGGSEITFAARPSADGSLFVPPVRFDDANHAREDFRHVPPPDLARLAGSHKTAKANARFAKLRQIEIAAKSSLKVATKEHCANLAILASGSPSAFNLAKIQLSARRELRAALTNPETIPAWYPLTYQDKTTETRNVLNPDGTRKLDPFYLSAYNLALGVAEYVGMAPEVRDFWYQTEQVTTPVTMDARAKYREAIAAVKAAQSALADYKPRKLESTARVSHRDRRRGVKPPLKQDKLVAELKAARDRVDNLLRAAFQDECERRGLSRQLAWGWFQPVRQFSRARIAVRSWAARKLSLATNYHLAIKARRKAQSATAAA